MYGTATAPLVDIMEAAVRSVRNVRAERTRTASIWLKELRDTVLAWDKDFRDALSKYPGFWNSKNQQEYTEFFAATLRYRADLDERAEHVKTNLCTKLKHLYIRFPEDFGFMKTENESAYDDLYQLVGVAYRSEIGIIDRAKDTISRILDPDPREIMEAAKEDYGSWWQLPDLQRVSRDWFVQWHMEHPDKTCALIRSYDAETLQNIQNIKISSDRFSIASLPIEESGENGPLQVPNVSISLPRDFNAMQPTVQERYRHTYTLLAWGSGVLFLVALLVISVLLGQQTPQSLKVQAAILALAAAAFTTVMTGIMNISANLGTQLIIGATGAFAVLVLFYLQNPAILQ